MSLRAVMLAAENDVAGWRSQARALLREGVPPEQVTWSNEGGEADLVTAATATEPPAAARTEPCARRPPGPPVPRRFIALAEEVILHSDPARFAVLYALLWRLTHGEPRLLAAASDPLLHRAEVMATAVRRDIHKMKAFVRFRPVADEGGGLDLAWFEPAHHIVEATAPFFVRRFASMRWSILTPRRCAFWDGEQLAFAPGIPDGKAAKEDAVDDLWRRYYASIFNPARLQPKAMRAQMPQRYWHNLPETALIPSLCSTAQARTQAMLTAVPAAAVAGEHRQVELPMTKLTQPAERHRASCGARRQGAAHALYAPATQTVFGEGPAPAPLMLVGEQPGDQEDLAGRPFVGPAGMLLDRALRDAGLDRRAIYVTNAIKHFKFVLRGKRRLHQKPNTMEIDVCRSWLQREIGLVQPQTVVALGATAARALSGRELRIGVSRGRRLTLQNGLDFRVTVHPSYLLRLPDEAARAAEYRAFVADLEQVAALAPLAAGA